MPRFRTNKRRLQKLWTNKVSINQIEWLFLASQGHRRALFEVVKNDGRFLIEGKWLIP